MTEPKRQSSVDLFSKNFKTKFDLWRAEVSKKYPNARVFESLRTKERQAWLYGVGRTHSLTRKPISWTLQSKHITGDAVDIVFNDGKGNPTRNWPYDDLIEIAKKYNIENLKPTETCHFQDNGVTLTKKLSDKDSVTIKECMSANSEMYLYTQDNDLKKLLHWVNEKIRSIYPL